MQRKRSLGEVEIPATPTEPMLTSSRGRIVKPRIWEDGAEAPVALAGSRLQRTALPKQEAQSPVDGDKPASAGRCSPSWLALDSKQSSQCRVLVVECSGPASAGRERPALGCELWFRFLYAVCWRRMLCPVSCSMQSRRFTLAPSQSFFHGVWALKLREGCVCMLAPGNAVSLLRSRTGQNRCLGLMQAPSQCWSCATGPWTDFEHEHEQARHSPSA